MGSNILERIQFTPIVPLMVSQHASTCGAAQGGDVGGGGSVGAAATQAMESEDRAVINWNCILSRCVIN